MAQQNWWNSSFDDMMDDLGKWLAERPGITIVHLDWKFVVRPSENDGYWYMLCVYR
jgi:hypothetical protein